MSPRLVIATLLASALSLTALSSAPAASQPPPAPVAKQPDQGTVGIGDPYFPSAGNPGYDARSYAISVRYRPGTGMLTGDTTVRIKPSVRLTHFNLDLLLRADSVRLDGASTPFSQSRHELTVRPRIPLRAGQVVRVRVTYHGKPAGIRYGGERPFEKTSSGAIAVGEPAIAAWWFPSNDHPSDKARFRITLRVPRGYEAISDGTLDRHRDVRKTSVWRWSVDSPMATYLAFAAFGQYDVERGKTAAGLPYLYAFEKGLGGLARRARGSVRQTPSIVRWLSKTWGPYPFQSLGGVVPNVNLGYALENQTRPVYGRDMFRYGPDRSLIVHELAHQWFGDRVSLRRWKDIWLNEGLATYSEWLWEAHLGGRTAQQQFMRFYNLFESSNSFWDLPIGNPGPQRMFDDAVYERGAMTAHALRNRVGSHDFFEIMRGWSHGKDRLATTHGFKLLAERISGEQLDGLFQHWLYAGTKPARTAENGL